MNTTTLASLAALLEENGLLAGTHNLNDQTTATTVSGADCDSRHAAPGHVFICKGAAFKAAYLLSALDAGAVAYLCDKAHEQGLSAAAPEAPALVATDEGLRRAMALISAEAFGRPDRELKVLGITGTKGKSTVSYMLRAVLNEGAPADAPRAGVMGSIDTFDGVESEESHNTTPESPDLWRHLANARDAGLAYMDMEVSSQGLKYDRVLGLEFDVACFLNIGRDHISPVEHPDFEDYFASKLRIFEQARAAVVNLDADHADRIRVAAAGVPRVLTFSAAGKPGADVWAADVASALGQVSFTAHTPSWEGPVTLAMPGLFNVDNALATIAIAELLGLGREQVVAGLAKATVPGRMELIRTPSPKVTALVDYAHNKLSYQRFFPSVKEEFPGYRVIALFGAPGGKAYERREELPQEAAKWADYLIYTEEDPAHDPVEEICAQMAAATPEGAAYEVICDREKAVYRACELAFNGEGPAIVCLLAKGDETRQHEGDLFVPCRTDGEIFEEAVRMELTRAYDPERTVVVATGNAHKVVEIEAILAPVMPGVRFVALGEIGDFPDPVEDGDTFAANALIKARAAQEQTGLPMAVADDSGLCVDALGGEPGIFSARWAGEHGNDAANNQKLMERMADVPDAERTARFHSSVVLVRGDEVLGGEGDCEGMIGRVPRGEYGFGYDPLFLPAETPGRTMAELELSEKNLISHRFHALEDLAAKLG